MRPSLKAQWHPNWNFEEWRPYTEEELKNKLKRRL